MIRGQISWSPSPGEQSAADVPLSRLSANVESYSSLLSEHTDRSAAVEYEVIESLLLADYSPPLRPEMVRHHLLDCIQEFESASVRTYLPVLIEREVRVRLRAIVNGRSSPPRR